MADKIILLVLLLTIMIIALLIVILSPKEEEEIKKRRDSIYRTKPNEGEGMTTGMVDRLQSLVNSLDDSVDKDKKMNEVLSVTQPLHITVKKDMITTIKNVKVNVLGIVSVSTYLMILFMISLTATTILGVPSAILIILIGIVQLFNIMNTVLKVQWYNQIKQACLFIEQNSNHYQTSVNFAQSVATTMNSLNPNTWIYKKLDNFLIKVSMGNYSVIRALQELKMETGNIKYLNMYINRVIPAEKLDNSLKVTTLGIPGPFRRKINEETGTLSASILGFVFITFTTLIAIYRSFGAIMVVRLSDVTTNKHLLISKAIIIIILIVILLVQILIYNTLLPEQVDKWGEDNE